MDIKPIETIYNGYRFRSRLEARWAVFFDAAYIEYQYEPDGFYGIDNKPYLPDFYLPQFDVYAEVKGTDEDLYKCSVKIGECIDYGASEISYKGLLLLGNIPYRDFFFPYFPLLIWNKGVCVATAIFDILEGKPCLKRSDNDGLAFEYFNGKGLPETEYLCASGEIPKGLTIKPQYINSIYSGNNSDPYYINICYGKARQARFEHREKPNY